MSVQGAGMVILVRNIGEELAIGEAIRVRVVSVEGTKVRLGVEAPEEVWQRRKELEPKVPEG